MKKLFLVLMTSLTLLTGCDMIEDMDNTPTKKVEAYLNKFQMADNDVESYIEDTIVFGSFQEKVIESFSKMFRWVYFKAQSMYSMKRGDRSEETDKI